MQVVTLCLAVLTYRTHCFVLQSYLFSVELVRYIQGNVAYYATSAECRHVGSNMLVQKLLLMLKEIHSDNSSKRHVNTSAPAKILHRLRNGAALICSQVTPKKECAPFKKKAPYNKTCLRIIMFLSFLQV